MPTNSIFSDSTVGGVEDVRVFFLAMIISNYRKMMSTVHLMSAISDVIKLFYDVQLERSAHFTQAGTIAHDRVKSLCTIVVSSDDDADGNKRGNGRTREHFIQCCPFLPLIYRYILCTDKQAVFDDDILSRRIRIGSKGKTACEPLYADSVIVRSIRPELNDVEDDAPKMRKGN